MRFVIVSLVVLLGLELAVRLTRLPPALLLPQSATPVVLDRDGRVIAELGNGETRGCMPLTLDKISPWMISATLTAEDHRFYQHSGIDWIALGGAMAHNLTELRVVSGASTLTQQLIKLESGNARRSLAVKLRENLAALRLEREWTKSAILERYLNRVEYGNRLRGVGAAARAYFGKSALELTLAEAVYLSGIPQSPSRFNPRTHPDRAEERYRQVCRKLQRLRVLDSDQIASLAVVPTLRPIKNPPPPAPHFIAKLRQLGQPLEGEVRTTLDLDLQRQVEGILARHLWRLSPLGAHNAAALVLDHRDGSVRAWCGSGNWSSPNGQIDGVTLPRSCGSTLKPFLYLRALDRRIMTAASLLPDTPDAIRGEYLDYDPRNYDDRFWGPVRLREALANSLNVPAVFTLARVGARDTYDYLRRSGIPLARPIEQYGAGLILGNAEVRMLDLAAAYGALAHQGVAARPRLLQGEPIRNLAISSPEAAAIVADILSDNNARRKTFGPFSPLAFDGVRVACKTGTSSGFRDAWTFGVTGRHVVAVWVGNFSGAPMREVASVTGPAPAWRDIVNLLIAKDGGLTPPDASLALETEPICPLTGFKPTPLGPQPIKELFIRGTAPQEDAAPYFFQQNGVTKVCLPPEYAVWCRSSHNYLDAVVRSGGPLAIVTPRPDARYLIDSTIPAQRQKIEFIAVGPDKSPIHWEINGQALSADGDGGNVFWSLQRGTHHLSARQGEMNEEITFHVE